jgi:hypothetical protein
MTLSDRSPRRSWKASAAALVLVLSLIVPAAAPAAAQEGDAERFEALEQEVEALRRALAELAARQAAAEEEAEEAAGEMAADPAAGDTAELARRIDLLAAEIERLSLGSEVAPAAAAEDGLYGLAPAASKVYRADRGLSIGGYGEVLYQAFDSSRDDGADSGKKDEIDFLRAILYFGYKFDDKLVFNSEIEVEHADEIFVEFAYLDYLHRPELNLRGGMVLLPMGLINELHEPTTFLPARRPDTESAIIPSTWRENGFGLWGEAGSLSYRTYLVNGLRADGFSSGGLRGGRQKGSHALAEDVAWVGRLDWSPQPGLVVGGSLYTGGSGQGVTTPDGHELSVDTTIFEGHVDWRWRGLTLRALAARADLDEVADLNRALGFTGGASVGEGLEGFYVEAGYDLFAGGERSLTPYLRWEQLDTQAEVPAGFVRNPARDVESLTLGLAFQPIDQIILKADYQDYDNGAGTGIDQINVALGYIF